MKDELGEKIMKEFVPLRPNSSVSRVYPNELFIRSKCYIFFECSLKE